MILLLNLKIYTIKKFLTLLEMKIYLLGSSPKKGFSNLKKTFQELIRKYLKVIQKKVFNLSEFFPKKETFR